MDKQVAVLARTTLHQGFFRLERLRLQHRLFSGAMGAPIEREVLHRGPAAAVILYDPVLDVLVLIEQFRIGAYLAGMHGGWMLELVAGILEPGEPPDALVRREALEEAGCEVLELVSVGQYLSSPASTPELIHLFCGRVDASRAGGVHGLVEEGEDIRVSVMPALQVLATELFTGRICSSAPLLALLWFAQERESLRKLWLGTC